MRVSDDDAPTGEGAGLVWTEWSHGALTAPVTATVSIQVSRLWTGGFQVALYTRARTGGTFAPQPGAYATREQARAAAEALATGLRR